MPSANGPSLRSVLRGHGSFRDPILHRMMGELYAKVKERQGITQNLGSPDRFLSRMGGGAQPDPRRNFEDDFGWPEVPDQQLYEKLFNFDSIAARIVALPALQCFKVNFDVYETEDEEDTTGFEDSYDNMLAGLRGEQNYYKPKQGLTPFASACRRLDILARKERYGVMWLGFDDDEDLSQPPPGVTINGSFPFTIEKGKDKVTWVNGPPPDKRANHYGEVTDNARRKGRKLLFLRPYPESQAVVTQWEGNRNSPRYMQPLAYRITVLDPNMGYSGMGLPTSTIDIHWLRCMHYADTYHHAVSSDSLATPALQVPLADVLDGRKVSGAGSEAFYRNAFVRIFFETLAQFGADALVNMDEIGDMMEDLENTSQRHGVLRGLHANPIQPTVPDPNPHLDAKYKRIAIHMGKAKRIFEGSERGELSSSQDERQDADEIKGRQYGHLCEAMIAPTINRLIFVGVLEPPAEENGFTIEFEDVDVSDSAEKAQIMAQRTQSFAAYVAGDVESILPLPHYLVDEAGYSQEKTEQILDDIEKQQLEEEQKNADLAAEHGMVPAPPPGFKEPPPEVPPPTVAPAKLAPGQALVHPETGAVVGKSPFPPKEGQS